MSGWSQWAWSDSLANSGLVMSAQALGLWMAQRADFDTGRFTGFAMTRRVIVDATGWHSGTIDKAIRELKKAGFLDGNSGEWRLLEQTLNSPHRQMSPPGETSHRQMSPPRERWVSSSGEVTSPPRETSPLSPRVPPIVPHRFADARRIMSEAWSSLTGATLPMPTSAIADAVAAVQVAAGVGDIDLDDASDEAVATLIANAWALSVERALETRPGCNAPRMDLVLRWHSLAVWAKNHGAKAVEAIAAYRAHLAEAAAAPPQRPRSQPAQPRPAEDPADLPTPEEISEMLAATRREIDNLDPFPARRFA